METFDVPVLAYQRAFKVYAYTPLLCSQYEGVSRMQTSLRRRHRDRVVRRGIGMMIESDFYATEAGRAHFSDQLTSIRSARARSHLGLAPASAPGTHGSLTPPCVGSAGTASRRPATLMRFSRILPAGTVSFLVFKPLQP